MIIPYQPEWDPAIEMLLDEVMGSGRFARTAERLREGNHAVHEFGFLVVDDHKVLQGAISFWPIVIGEVPALLLGPLAIRLALRGQGVGLNLITHARKIIMNERPMPILLVGDLSYYGRLGFAVAPLGIKLPGPVDPNRVLIWLPEGLSVPEGRVRSAPAL